MAATTKGLTQATVSAAAASGALTDSRSPSGTISLYPLRAAPTSTPLAVAPQGSSVLRYQVPAGKGTPLVVRATGDYAGGLTAAVTSRTTAGSGRSLQTAQCSPAAGDTWFVGSGANIGQRARIYLTNIDAAPATVDVTLYTPSGAQKPLPVQGRTIQPGQQFSIGIDSLVPNAPATAIHVVTRSGRVASAVSDSQVSGLVAQGADWVPATTAPSRRTVITGIPSDAKARRTLSLVVPGADDALVDVHLVTSDGTLSPIQGESVQGGRLVTIDLSKVPAATGPMAVVVESDRPVVAGIRTIRPAGGAGKFPDFSYSAGASPVEGAVLLPTVTHTASVGTVLQLTAPGDNDVVADLTTLVSSESRPRRPA